MFKGTKGIVALAAAASGEARDAETMAQRGMPIEQIRDTLRARYSHGE